MNQTNQFNLQRYKFSWVDRFSEKKRFKIQLTDSQEPKKNNQRYKGQFRRFLIRLRSD